MAVRLEVTPPGAGAKAEPLVYGFDQPRITLGRSTSADVRLPSRTVSESHAIIRLEEGSFVVVDQGSTNGTTHNGQVLVEGRRKLLRSGDQIGIAYSRITFHAGVAIDAAMTPDRTAGLARRIVREALGVLPVDRRSPLLVVLAGPDAGKRLEIGPPPCRLEVGRDADCALVLQDADVSRKHLELGRDWEGVVVRDLGSKNGITVNGRRVTERRLRDRDEIALAATVLGFEDGADAYLRELEGGPDERVTPGAADRSEAPTGKGSGAAGTDAAGPTPSATPAAAEQPPAEAPVAAAPVAAAPVAARPAAARPARRRSSGRSLADIAVFLLAAVVLVGSVAALVVLLRSG